jgi:hypothetical protein
MIEGECLVMMPATEGYMRSPSTILEAHKDPRSASRSRYATLGIWSGEQLTSSSRDRFQVKHPVIDRAEHKSRTSAAGLELTNSSDPSSSRAIASTEHNTMRHNVTVVASRRSRAQDQRKGSQSEDRMVGHHSSRRTVDVYNAA